MKSAMLVAMWALLPLPLSGADDSATDYAKILTANGVEPTPKGVLGYIRPLTGSQLQSYIQQLGDPIYDKRQAATHYLVTLPVVPVGALERAIASGDPEISYRAKDILKRAKKGRNVKLINAVLRTIRGTGYSEAAPILVDLIPQLGRTDLENAATDALLAIAEPKHAGVLRAALKESKHVKLRMAAMRTLQVVVGEKAIPDLRAVLSDSDDRIRLASAEALVRLKQRGALKTMAKLLGSNDVKIRGRAVAYLRTAWGKRLGFLAIDRSPARQRAATAWGTWVEKNGATANLEAAASTVFVSKLTTRGVLLHRIAAHESTAYSVEFSPDGKTIVSASGDGLMKLWDASTGRLVWEKKAHGSSTIRSAVFSPDGKTIATGSYDNTVKLFNAKTGAELRTLKGHTGSARIVAFSRDGSSLVSSSSDGTAIVWNVASGRAVHVLKGHNSTVRSVAVSADSKLIATGSSDRNVKIWDLKSGKLIHTLAGHRSSVRSVAFSPDSNTLISGSLDNTIRMWDVVSGAERVTLSGHTSSIKSLAYSTDGRFFVSGGNDRYLRIWDADTGELITSLSGPTSYIWHVAVSRDGSRAAACGSDRTIHVWKLETTGTAELRKRLVPKPQPRPELPRNEKSSRRNR